MFILGFWIGGQDEHQEYFPNVTPPPAGPGVIPPRPDNGYLGGQWTWSNGAAWTYINWASGQPANQGADDCVMMRSDNGQWEDFECTTRLKVCKIKFDRQILSLLFLKHVFHKYGKVRTVEIRFEHLFLHTLLFVFNFYQLGVKLKTQ